MKKLLILTFTFPPNADGVSEASAAMAYGLADRGWEVVVGTSFLEERKDFNPHPGVAVRHFKITGNENLRVGIHGEVGAYLDFLVETNADYLVAHCCDSWPVALACRVFSKLRAKKILISHGFSNHIPQFTDRPPWGVGFWLGWQPLTLKLPWLIRKYDHVVFLSPRRDFGRFFDHLIARATGYKNIEVIPNSVVSETLLPGVSSFRREHGIGAGPMFLCVANYSERKNQEMAVRAYSRLKKPETTLVFVGSEFNGYSDVLAAMIEETKTGNGRVLLLEKIPREGVLGALRECDVFVLSSKAETQPIVLLEAMAFSKPFISTNTGCVSELGGGIVVRNEGEMLEAMRLLVENPELRLKMGRDGQSEHAQKYEREKMLDAYERLLTPISGSP